MNVIEVNRASKFNPNKTTSEIINEGAFGGTYFRDIQALLVNGTVIVGKSLIF